MLRSCAGWRPSLVCPFVSVFQMIRTFLHAFSFLGEVDSSDTKASWLAQLTSLPVGQRTLGSRAYTFTKSENLAQQEHGADQSQPFMPVAIRASAAAGSGGSCLSFGCLMRLSFSDLLRRDIWGGGVLTFWYPIQMEFTPRRVLAPAGAQILPNLALHTMRAAPCCQPIRMSC